jgi:tetratricopeptide (TPR) repeat protein
MNKERINMLKNLREEDPLDPFPVYGLALEFINTVPLEAEMLFEQLLQNHPEYLPVYYTSAQFFSTKGEEEKAITILKKGISLSIIQQNEKATRELKSALEQLEF